MEAWSTIPNGNFVDFPIMSEPSLSTFQEDFRQYHMGQGSKSQMKSPASFGAYILRRQSLLILRGTLELCVLMVAVGACQSLLNGSEPYLVKDINPLLNTGNSNPVNFCTIGTTVYFTARSEYSGAELWKTDGTMEGTVLVKDISPGSSDSYPSFLTPVGETLYFEADDGIHGSELWRTDGTPEGTVLVKDIRPGSYGSGPGFIRSAGDKIYFLANDGTHGIELWISDGSENGTYMVRDLAPGSADSSPSYLTSAGEHLYFEADDGIHGSELWRSDGTASGTVMVRDIQDGAGSSSPAYFLLHDDTLFFAADDGIHGTELWTTDGTEMGTRMVMDLFPGTGASYPSVFNVNGTLFLRAGNGVNGTELWTTDGTEEGTTLLKDIRPGASSSSPGFYTTIGNTLFFQANDGVNGVELWKSDGTPIGTEMVRDILPGNPGSSPSRITNVDGIILFWADDGVNGQELWKSDGTTEGTTIVRDILEGNSGSVPSSIARIDHEIFFRADDGVHGEELWKSDGTTEGTVMVKDIHGGSRHSNSIGLTAVGDMLFFNANDGVQGDTLWKSNGMEEGTEMVKDFSSAHLLSSPPTGLTAVGDTLFFRVDDGIHGTELWKTDGTEGGTTMVKDIWPGFTSNPSNLVAVEDNLFFQADDGIHGMELWKSDGTQAGTVMIKDVWPGAGGAYYAIPQAIGGVLYFSGPDDSTQNTLPKKLWKSDGSANGTMMVKDPNGNGFSHNTPVSAMNGTLFFCTSDGIHGHELWRTDGTPNGSRMVKDIHSGFQSSSPRFLGSAGGILYFQAHDGVHGAELWRTDGTEEGTRLIKDINPGITDSSPAFATMIGSTLFFLANDGVFGTELWKSDGTNQGTVLVKDIREGPLSSNLYSLTRVENYLYFKANDGFNGMELWRSDGTQEGTAMVKDIFRGTGDSAPSSLTAVNGELFFTAITEESGRELWCVSSRDLSISGNGVEIRDGDVLPAGEDHTDFGTISAADAPVVRTFILSNLGTAGIHLTGTASVSLTGSDVFRILTQPSSSEIPAGGTTILSIAFAPRSAGRHSATVSITSSDPDESLYTFNIAGTVLSSDADLSNLEIEGGILHPAFDRGVSSFTVSVPILTDSIIAKPLISSSSANIETRLNGGPWSPAETSSVGFPINLDSGTNTVEFRVTAEDGSKRTYSIEVLKTEVHPVSFVEHLAGFDASLLPRQSHRFSFELSGPRFVQVLTDGAAGLSAVLLDGSYKTILAIQSGAEIDFSQLLREGVYFLEISHQAEPTTAQTYSLTIDAAREASVRPDLAIGSSPLNLTGRSAYPPSIQMMSLISRNVRPLTAYFSVANRGNWPEILLLRAGRGNRFISVRHFDSGGNATASLVAGIYLTPVIDEANEEIIFRSLIMPNRKGLVRKTKRGTILLKKSLILHISAESTSAPPASDEAALRFKVI